MRFFEGRAIVYEPESNTKYDLQGHIGVELMGSFGQQRVSQAQLESLAKIVAWLSQELKIDVSQVDVSMNGIELQDREFIAAIRERREPNSSVAQVLPCYEVLDQLERQLVG